MTRYAVLGRSPGFRRFWTASTLSMLGGELSLLAFPLLVLSLGDGAADAGAIMTFALVTAFAARLPAGSMADRCNLAHLMVGADLVRFAALGSIPLAHALGALGYPQLLLVAVVEGVASSLFGPASNVAVREAVADTDLERALSCMQTSSTMMGLAGPFLGGWLFTLNPMLPFAGDALSYLMSALLLSGMRLPPRAAPPRAAPRPTSGIRWLLRQRALLRALGFAAVLNLIGAAVGMTVVLSLREGGVSGTTIGAVTAGAGVGAILGALSAPRITRALGEGWLFVVIGTVWAAAFLALATRPPALLTAVLLASITFLSPSSSIVVQRAMMLLAPRDQLGQVLSAAGMLLTGVASFGPLAVGAALEAFGPAEAWMILAGACAAATLLWAVPLVRDGALVAPGEAPEQAVPQDPDPVTTGDHGP